MPGDQAQISRRAVLQTAGVGVPALSIAALLAGCGIGPEAAPTGPRALRVAQSEDPTTLDPQVQGSLTSMNVLINIFDTLTTRDTANTLQPRLALTWKAIDATTWRFTLRKGVRFHNGETFDAAVVKYSIERLLDPELKSEIVELRYVDSVSVVDDYTVDFHTTQPDPIIPEKLSLFGGVMVPPKYIDEVGTEGFAAKPVGTGPFIFDSWRRDFQLKLHAVDDHWAGQPQVRELVFMPMPNPASALAALQSDGVDIVSGLTPDAALQLQGYAGVEIKTFPGIRMSFINLDTEHELLKDVRIRRALNHAMDVPLLIDAVLDGKAREAPTVIPAESFGFDPSIKPYERSVERARQLLADAGHPDGITLTFTASNEDAFVAQAIAGLMKKAGITIDLDLLDPGTFSERRISDNKRALGPMYLTASTGWTLDGQATMQSYVRSDRRQSRMNSPEADRLVDLIENKIDPATRTRAFNRMQRLLHDQAPFVFLYQIDLLYAMSSSVRWKPNVIGSLEMATAEVEHG